MVLKAVVAIVVGVDVGKNLSSLFVSLEMLKSLNCRLGVGDIGDGLRIQSAHVSEVASPFFK